MYWGDFGESDTGEVRRWAQLSASGAFRLREFCGGHEVYFQRNAGQAAADQVKACLKEDVEGALLAISRRA